MRRIPFSVIFETYPDGSMSPRFDVVIGKASLAAKSKIKHAKLSALAGSIVEMDGDQIMSFILGGRVIQADSL